MRATPRRAARHALIAALLILSTLLTIFPAPALSHAQTDDRTLSYGETVSGILTDDEPTHQWTFAGEAHDRLEITVRRISGRFTPRISLSQQEKGAFITPTGDEADDFEQRLVFEAGLLTAGTYTITVTGEDRVEMITNPTEYGLTLTWIGRSPADVYAGLTIPAVGLTPLKVAVESGTPVPSNDDRSRLELDIYGAVTVERPDPGGHPAEFELRASPYGIATLFNGQVISRMLRSISFLDEGIGLTSLDGAIFFTDQSISYLENDFSTISVTLANRQTITTDFFGLASIETVDDLIVARTVDGQRIILSGQTLALVEENGQLRISADGGCSVLTDRVGWHTLAYLPQTNTPGLNILFEDDWRLRTDRGFFTLTQAPAPPVAYNLRFDLIPENPDDELMPVRIDPHGIGDVELRDELLTVTTLDERVLSEPLATLAALGTEDRAVLFTRTDNSRRLSLPDLTEIEMIGSFEPLADALPGEPGFLAHGHNNLGTDLIPTFPQVNTVEMPPQVNPVNGNFRYTVQDFRADDVTLPLDFARHYHSEYFGLTPSYMTEAPNGYLLGQMGVGWRHSYQIELDLRLLPTGRVQLILPDGAMHVFELADPAKLRFRSETLGMWTIERLSGATGAWRATRTDGLRYDFDRAGRLVRITDRNERTMTFSPAPRSYLAQNDAAAGFFVVDPYGRRQEVYIDANGLIARVRHADSFDIQYTYASDGTLIGVTYPELDAVATYGYDGPWLVSVDDARSPYHQSLRLDYDGRGRLLEFEENPGGDMSRLYTYTYDDLATTQRLRVGGDTRVWRWEFSPEHRVTRYELPLFATDDKWFYEYEYTGTNPNYITAHRLPGGRHITFRFNEFGHMEAFLDPVYTNTGQTTITYESYDDDRRLRVTGIDSGDGYDIFEFDELSRVIRHRELLRIENDVIERVTRYEYNVDGRVTAVITPGPNSTEEAPQDVYTRYGYDDFGYVSAISEGNSARTIQVVYDRVGSLRSITDGRGNQTRIEWSPTGQRITRIVDALGNPIQYLYDERGNLISLEQGGAATLYGYNDLNQVIWVSDPLGATTQYTYDEVGNVLAITLNDGVAQETYTYDKQDYLSSSSTADGLVTRYNVWWERTGPNDPTPTGRLIHEHINPAGESTRYVYDPLGRLRNIFVRDARGIDTTVYELSYNGADRLASIDRSSGSRGFESLIQYNVIGQPTATTVATERTIYQYNAAGWISTVIEPDGGQTTYTYDLLGNVTSITLPGNEQSPAPVYTYTYDESGNIVACTSPIGYVTQYVYDDLNRLSSMIDPLGSQTSFNYDARGNLISVTDPNGVIHEAVYDDANRLVSTVDGLGNATDYEYDGLGRVTRITAPNNLNYQEYTYDPNNNIIAISYPRERRILFNYDVLGRVTGVMDALGHTTVYNYNPLGMVNQVIDPLGNIDQYLWHSDGKLYQHISPSGNRYEYVLDFAGRITQITNLDASSGGNNNVYIVYDEAGNITDFEFANSRTKNTANSLHYRFTYTPQGWLSSFTDPLESTWEFTYNAEGWLTQMLDPRGTVQITAYDAAGRPVRVTSAAGTDVEQVEAFAYDANGQITRYTAPGGLVSEFVYDTNGYLKQRIDGTNTDSPRTVLFEYDELGNLIAVIDPEGNTTRYTYDFGRITDQEMQLVDPEGGEPTIIRYQFEYDKVGNLSSVTLPEGDVANGGDTGPAQDYQVNLTYNALNLRVRYIDSEDKVWTYTYDAERQLLQTGDPLGNVTTYEYDTSGRVQQIVFPTGAVIDLRYDDAGNFHGVVGPETETRRNVGQPNEVIGTEKPTITYTLDVMGNLVAIEDVDLSQTSFTYDTLGNLTSRTYPDGVETTYSYDPLGRLITRMSPEGTVRWTYDLDDRPVAVTAGRARYTFEYTPFGELQTAAGPGLTLSYTTDPVGNVTLVDAGAFGQCEFEYDSLYRRVGVTHGDASATLSYDRNGWLTGITRSNGLTTTYRYNTNGDPIQVLHRGDGIVDLWTYAYDDAGNITRINRGDRWATLFSYDASNHLIDERWLNPNNRAEYAANFRYDPAGNLVEKTVSVHGQLPAHTLFVYDRENQLITEVRNYEPPARNNVTAITFAPLLLLGVIVSWRMGRRSRRLAALGLGLTVVALGAGLLASSAAAQDGAASYRIDYEYDKRGNLIRAVFPAEDDDSGANGDSAADGDSAANGAVIDYEYDSENRLIRISGTNASGAALDTRLTYDPFNRLVGWQTPDHDVKLYYNERTLIGMEDLTTGERYSTVEPLPGLQLLDVLPDGSTQWPLYDGQGAVRRVLTGTDAASGVYGGIEYNSFGEMIQPYGADQAQARPTLPAVLFNGYLYEPTSGFYFTPEQRVYDPHLGRYIQRDPVRHDPRATLYTYQYNHPNDAHGFRAEAPDLAVQTELYGDRVGNLPVAPVPEPAFQLPYSALDQGQGLSTLIPDETIRVMRAMQYAQFDLNAAPRALDPLLRDFYVLDAHPEPASLKPLDFAWQNRITDVYALGWSAFPTPSPYESLTVMDMLHDLTPFMLQADAVAFDWYTTADTQYLPLPVDPTPVVIPAQVQNERGFMALLQEPVVLPRLHTELDTLWDSVYPAVLVAPWAEVNVPDPLIAFPVLRQIDDLRARQGAFWEQNQQIGGVWR